MNETNTLFGGVIPTTTVTTTAGAIILPTFGKAVMAVEFENSGSVALNSMALYRRAYPGMTWELLNDITADWAVDDPQIKAYAVTAEDSDVALDPTTLAAADKVKIYVPVDGNQHVKFAPTVSADTTTLVGAFGCGD